MSFAPRLVAIVLLVFVAACAPAARNGAKTPAKSAQSAASAKSAPAKPGSGKPAPATSAPGKPALPQSAPPAAAAPALPEATATTGAPAGYGGIPWGAPASSQPGLAQSDASPESGTTTCLWPQGPKEVAGAPVREAFYEFFKNQFYHVWINFDGMAAYETALAGLTRTYGPPSQENREKYYHAWTLGDVNIYCAFHPDLNEGDVSFFYQPLYERMKAARQAGTAKTPGRRAKP
ncbi:hypothetical protein [Solidesulfovibrio sp.]